MWTQNTEERSKQIKPQHNTENKKRCATRARTQTKTKQIK
jgi:hypothetical protein